MALDDPALNATKIVRAPRPFSVGPKYQEMKNVADAVRMRLREGKLPEAIEALTSTMAVLVGTITTPKKKFHFF